MSTPVKMRPIGLVVVILTMLTACGQKRALYLPDTPQSNAPSKTSIPAKTTAVQKKD